MCLHSLSLSVHFVLGPEKRCIIGILYIYILYRKGLYRRGREEGEGVAAQTAIIVARGSRIPVTHGSVDRRGEAVSRLPTGF